VSVPKAVAFDNDGLLLDTEILWTRAEQKLFRRRGLEFTPEHKLRVVGTSSWVAGPILAELLDEPGRAEALISELNELVMVEAQGGGEPMPGAIELLDALVEAGVRLGLVSNSPPEFVQAVIGPTGLASRFEFTVTPYDGFDPKPSPDLYLEACRRLRAQPAETVALEDSAPGVGAAVAAGMRVIGIPSVAGVELDDCELVAGSLSTTEVWEALGLSSP
jgi:HAD superfamily hydrolase (TIGR01509 family)